MSFFPKNQKFTKRQKGKSSNKITSILTINHLKFGRIGLKAIENGRITSKQLEAIYKIIKKKIKKSGRLVLKIFPQIPITKKPIETRMGKGKGVVEYWVSNIKPGMILCEIETNSLLTASNALTSAKLRLPIKTKITTKF